MNKKQLESYIGKLIEFRISGNIYLGVDIKDDELYVIPILINKPQNMIIGITISEYALKYETKVI